MLTGDPHQMPAIWCLFSIGLPVIGLSPWLRGRVGGRGAPLRPASVS
ncbi:hypothetical protein [Falsiroseomonas sp. HW251]